MSLPIYNLLKSYTKSIVSHQILQAPYQEIYRKILTENPLLYESILIINQGVYVSLAPYFEEIERKEYHLTYLDENPISIQQLNQEMIQYQRGRNGSLPVETIQNDIYRLKDVRWKTMEYDTVFIHHMNSFYPESERIYDLLYEILHQGSQVIFFITVSDGTREYKNRIRNYISDLTDLKIGELYSLEEIIISIPQSRFKIHHIKPYRESFYLGYGKNIIYQFQIEKI